ncbi:unnamed protein product [Triticum aestivum]|uniref:Uncharacterized protein n=1 Tax=Triticum aestivum TaxID=4565 RepID=A0A7H4LMM5_WHEAT|nr:unnamed protein product [Triticum aestivum]
MRCSVVHESDVQQMSRLHLRQLVVWGQWREAVKYINRFLPPADDRGVETRSLLLFLHTLWSLANVAACSAGGFVNDSVRRDLHFLTNLCCRNVKLNSILQYTLHSPQFTASLDWKLVREKASLIADDWALETPELRRMLQLPGGRGLAQDLLPIGWVPPPSSKAPPEATIPAAKAGGHCQGLSQQEEEPAIFKPTLWIARQCNQPGGRSY